MLKFAIERNGNVSMIGNVHSEDIVYIKAEDGYRMLYKVDGENVSYRDTIANLEEELVYSGFVRIND